MITQAERGIIPDIKDIFSLAANINIISSDVCAAAISYMYHHITCTSVGFPSRGFMLPISFPSPTGEQ